jgi:tetratricopeptide (TPR) repeat protein
MTAKEKFKTFAILLLVIVAFFGIFVYKNVSTRNTLATRIAALSNRKVNPKTVKDLRNAIDQYGKKIDQHKADIHDIGIYWKLLGSKLLDEKKPMYGEALDALKEAVRYFPEDEAIHYLIGMAAGNMAKAEYFSPEEQAENYRISEAAYIRAIDLYNNYSRALYGLGVLYVFELQRPDEAIPYLERFLELDKFDTKGMFALAAAKYMTEDYAGAADMYDRIVSLSKDKEEKKNAELLKRQVMDEWYR